MTEISRPWGGTATGDKGPYSDDNWTDAWSGLFARTGANVGVLRGAANELIVTSSGDNAISVNTGEALVDGTWYQSDAATAVTPGIPSSDPRIDRIVLRKSWSAQTVRVTRIEGTEAGSPSAPSLTQTDGTTWDIPLAQYQIATGAGAISSLTDQREFVHDPTGAVDVADGGTGATSLTEGGILLGSGTAAITAMAVLGDGVIVVGDNSTDPTTITALTSSTGTLKHEVGGMEFDASAVTTGDIIAGASSGTMAIVAASGASEGDVLTIQGDGTTDYETITGVGTVTSGTISTGAVIADATMTLGSDADGDMYYRASNVLTRLAKGSDNDTLMMNGNVPNWEAAAAGGLTEADSWRNTVGFAPGVGTTYVLTANLARVTSTGFGLLGTGMSESSGVFTFPSTGYWAVLASFGFSLAGDSRYDQGTIEASVDAGSTWAAHSMQVTGSTQFESASLEYYIMVYALLDVTDTANVLVRFSIHDLDDDGVNVSGTDNRTSFHFLKLGDT